MTSRPFDYTRDQDFDALPKDDWNEAVPHLIQADAGLSAETAWAMGVRVLVNVAGWMREPVGVPPGCLYLAWKIEDDRSTAPDEATLRDLGALLAARVRARETVAVYCAGGLNRSGLVVGHTLVARPHG